MEEPRVLFTIFKHIFYKGVVSMRVSDLQIKDVVSLIDGRKLGRIVDIDLKEDGNVNYFVIEPKRFFHFFGSSGEVNVAMNQIKKIGEDVILVEI